MTSVFVGVACVCTCVVCVCVPKPHSPGLEGGILGLEEVYDQCVRVRALLGMFVCICMCGMRVYMCA